MASAGLDTMITVKVNFDGTTRRTKMPLRDMVPGTLETNIRTFLHIPADTETIFERYSDSASSFVQLTPGNIPVYKQLYRAAKAKSKLKIRVTQPQKTVPKPASVEDEPEASPSSPAPETPPEETSEEKSEEKSEEIQPEIKPATSPAPPKPTSNTTPSQTTLPFRCSMPPPINTMPGSYGTSTATLVEASNADALRAYFTPNPRGVYPPADYSVFGTGWNVSASPHRLSPVSCTAVCPATGANFAVCCNNCEKTIPDVHFHCSTCDDGDFDLCQGCVDEGITCYGDDHWLIKRTTINGRLVQSRTETIAPKRREKKEEPKTEKKMEDFKWGPQCIECKFDRPGPPSLPKPAFEPLLTRWATLGNMRTCNCCVQELPESEFLHCNTCEDYDLCQPCFAKDGHGHHPKHAFVPAVKGTNMPEHIKVKMTPGRNQVHHAICDGCDKYIAGVRHKCLDCPDWDYCRDCIQNANFIHPGHRFVPIYDQLSNVRACSPQPVHVGICCDGPLCADGGAYPAYIRGVRYKCAVCPDLDLCANCEASPSNTHNKTHPLIKFKTPVRHVSVSTTGEHQDGKKMRVMGDRNPSNSRSTETVSPSQGNSMNTVQTVVDVKPEPTPTEKAPEPELKQETFVPEVEEAKEAESSVENIRKQIDERDLRAVFLRDTIEDGTILPPNHVFEQTWTLRNEGNVAWPAGCSVKFVGGDYMGHVDSNHPAEISKLVSASESTVCYAPLAPGQEFPFTVLLRTPARAGKIISYWRLTTQDGFKFGHRLWCDVNVRMVKDSEVKASPPRALEEPKQEDESLVSSQMIFPKLEKESPVASIHMNEAPEEPETKAEEPENIEDVEEEEEEEEDDEWEASDEGFMTDEEYDILDASDEEYLEEQKKKLATK
ncbi:Fc.00g101290.m01.CDS01 [Cosmosporella sp. VM-42]